MQETGGSGSVGLPLVELRISIPTFLQIAAGFSLMSGIAIIHRQRQSLGSTKVVTWWNSPKKGFQNGPVAQHEKNQSYPAYTSRRARQAADGSRVGDQIQD